MVNMVGVNNKGGGSYTSTNKDLQRAFSTYLNVTGPGEYSLPSLVSNKSTVSTKRNAPMFTF